MRWQDKLTKEEHKHLREGGMRTLADFVKNRKWQVRKRNAEIKRGRTYNPEPCPICPTIARKLGMK